MSRTEQISNLRDKGYEVVEITVPKGMDDNNTRPSAIMFNRVTENTVLVRHTGEVVSLSAGGS